MWVVCEQVGMARMQAALLCVYVVCVSFSLSSTVQLMARLVSIAHLQLASILSAHSLVLLQCEAKGR